MEVSSEEPTKAVEATPQEQSNVDEEFTADGNIEQEGEFEEGSDFGFSPGGGFRYATFFPPSKQNLINQSILCVVTNRTIISGFSGIKSDLRK